MKNKTNLLKIAIANVKNKPGPVRPFSVETREIGKSKLGDEVELKVYGKVASQSADGRSIIEVSEVELFGDEESENDETEQEKTKRVPIVRLATEPVP